MNTETVTLTKDQLKKFIKQIFSDWSGYYDNFIEGYNFDQFPKDEALEDLRQLQKSVEKEPLTAITIWAQKYLTPEQKRFLANDLHERAGNECIEFLKFIREYDEDNWQKNKLFNPSENLTPEQLFELFRKGK